MTDLNKIRHHAVIEFLPRYIGYRAVTRMVSVCLSVHQTRGKTEKKGMVCGGDHF